MLIVLKIINLQQHRLNLMHYNKLVVLSQIVVLEHNLEYNQIYMTKYKIVELELQPYGMVHLQLSQA